MAAIMFDPLCPRCPPWWSVSAPLSKIGLQQAAELLLRAIQLRFQRPERKLQRLGKILVLYAAQIVRRDEQAIMRRQTSDGFLEAIAKLEVPELPVRGTGRHAIPRAIIVERHGGQRPSLILHAHVCHDAVDPCGEPRLAPKVRQPAVDPEEYVLCQILGARPVLNRPANQRENQIFVAVDQLLKGPFIPATATLDELALVDRVHPVTVLEHASAGIVSSWLV